MKALILKIAMSLAFLIAAYVFVSIRLTTPKMFNLILEEPAIPEHEGFTTFGENYYKAGLIEHFRENLPPTRGKFRLSDENKSPEEADVLIFGDSHFDFSRQATFAERIRDSLNVKVYLHRFGRPHEGNILSFLKSINYKGTRPKILIYESTERYSISRTMKPFVDKNIAIKHESKVAASFRVIKNRIFNPYAESLYQTFLKKSYLTRYLYCKISTLRFDIFGYIGEEIHEYSLTAKGGPRLFHGETVNFFNRTDITDSLVNQCASNIQSLQRILKEKYNLELIFLIIPEKYTIYNLKYTDKTYHNYLPKIQHAFQRFDIPYIDIFNDFSSSEKILYYRTDTHWNKNGVDIAVNKTLKYLRTNNWKRFYNIYKSKE